MRKAKCKVGEIVEIPDYCFAPNRRGWNGWLFANAQVVKLLGKNKFGQKVYLLDVCDRHGRNGEHYEKNISENRIFENHGLVEFAQEQVDAHQASDYCGGRYNTTVYWLAEKGLVTNLR